MRERNVVYLGHTDIKDIGDKLYTEKERNKSESEKEDLPSYQFI